MAKFWVGVAVGWYSCALAMWAALWVFTKITGYDSVSAFLRGDRLPAPPQEDQ